MSQPADQPADPPPPWRTALRDVLLVAALVLAVVLGAAVLTSVLSVDLQRIVFHTPLAIGLLLIGTAWILWRISRRPPPEA